MLVTALDPRMQALEDAAGSGLTKRWDDRMDQRSHSRSTQPEGKAEGKAHVLEIRLIHRRWVIKENRNEWIFTLSGL